MSLRLALSILPAALAAVLGGCSSPVFGGDHEQPALIQILPTFPLQMVVPETVRAGVPFTVQITAHGGGCVRRGSTRVRTTDLTADLRPFDIDSRGDICPADAVTYTHEATVRFVRAGNGVVRVHGRSEPGREMITVVRPVEVLP